MTPCCRVDGWSIERIWRPGARYGAPEAAAQGDQGTEHGHRAALEARRADARQLPHEQPEIEAADMHEHTLLPAQMRAAHPPGLVETLGRSATRPSGAIQPIFAHGRPDICRLMA